MASNTNNLGLLKKDPVADGNDTFNVRTMLNDNWDKIDEFAGKTTPISKGGTGATTAAQALSNLGAAAVSDVGNLHVWERVQSGVTDYLTSTDRNAYPDNVTDAQDAYYTLGDVVSGTFRVNAVYDGTYVQYANSVNVTDNGVVTLAGQSGYDLWAEEDSYNNAKKLAGKFIVATAAHIYCKIPKDVVLFIPADTTISFRQDVPGDEGYGIFFDRYQPVTGHAAIPANTTITYLGQLGGGARIEVGSYVGTGTYGYENWCSISFGSVPKMVFLGPGDVNGGVVKILWPGATKAGSYYNNSSLLSIGWENGNKTVSWCSTNSVEHQCNTSGKTYYVYAIV